MQIPCTDASLGTLYKVMSGADDVSLVLLSDFLPTGLGAECLTENRRQVALSHLLGLA